MDISLLSGPDRLMLLFEFFGAPIFAKATFEEILDDLSSRFIINVPEVELASVERICFQVEQAHWFYEDFVREIKPDLPSFQLKTFSAKIFKHCPLLHQWAHEHERAYADFMQYRFRIPVCGAIIINPSLDKCVLVKGWSSKSGWGFPKGKINQEEEYDSCAIREVLEETGYDIGPLLKKTEYVELTMREQRIRLYIIQGVPETTEFIPRTRKEISQISWIRLEDLPTYKTVEPRHTTGSLNYVKAGAYRFYMVVPFVNQLKKIINQRKKSLRKANEKAPKLQSPRKVIQAEVNIPSSPLSYQSATPSNALKSMLGVGPENQKGIFPAASPANSQPHPTHQPPPITGNNLLQQLFSSASNVPQQHSEQPTFQQPFSPSPNAPQHQEKTTLQQQSMLSSLNTENPHPITPVHNNHLKPSTSENTVRRNSLLDLLQGNSRNEPTKVIDPVQAFMQGNIQIQSHEHLYSPTFNNSME